VGTATKGTALTGKRFHHDWRLAIAMDVMSDDPALAPRESAPSVRWRCQPPGEVGDPQEAKV
jgi:hypothetical protein